MFLYQSFLSFFSVWLLNEESYLKVEAEKIAQADHSHLALTVEIWFMQENDCSLGENMQVSPSVYVALSCVKSLLQRLGYLRKEKNCFTLSKFWTHLFWTQGRTSSNLAMVRPGEPHLFFKIMQQCQRFAQSTAHNCLIFSLLVDRWRPCKTF